MMMERAWEAIARWRVVMDFRPAERVAPAPWMSWKVRELKSYGD